MGSSRVQVNISKSWQSDVRSDVWANLFLPFSSAKFPVMCLNLAPKTECNMRMRTSNFFTHYFTAGANCNLSERSQRNTSTGPSAAIDSQSSHGKSNESTPGEASISSACLQTHHYHQSYDPKSISQTNNRPQRHYCGDADAQQGTYKFSYNLSICPMPRRCHWSENLKPKGSLCERVTMIVIVSRT